jgi:ABC-type branched-subunit amino acid transport system ATPase component
MTIENLTGGYEATNDILMGISFAIEEGKITSIVGPNGAGKSTLLKAIFGILPFRRGTILFKGENLIEFDNFSILKKGISYVPQGMSIFPEMSIMENLELATYTRRNEGRAHISETLEKFQMLKTKKHQMAGNLSGGERQVLGMAMALLTKPVFILIDEPSLGLDAKSCNAIFETIRNINKEGITVLMVEQKILDCLAFSDYAAIFNMGKIDLYAPVKEVKEAQYIKKLYFEEKEKSAG